MDPSSKSKTTPAKNHLRYLDALRGIAILGVILVHSNQVALTPMAGFLYDLTLSGQRGVQLFYVVSAFTLCYSFEIRPRQEVHSLQNYFIRRFFRIAPLFYVAVAGSFLLYGFGPRDSAPNGLTPVEILLGLLFLNGFHPDTINSIAIGGWSIAVETSFYLVLPLILIFVNSVGRSLIFLIFSAIVAQMISQVGVNSTTDPRWHEYFQFYWFPIELPIFCLGICGYQIWKHYRDYPWVLLHRKSISLLLVLLSVMIFLTSIPISNTKLYWSSLAFLPLVLGLSLHDWKVLVNPVTIFLGKISYSFYLMHFFCVIALYHLWLHIRHVNLLGFDPEDNVGALAVVFMAILLPSTALSLVTYFVVEKPGIRFGRDLIQRREKIPIAARI